MKYRVWTDKHVALLKELYPRADVSTEHLQQLLGRSRQALHHKALALGLQRPSTKWTQHLILGYFDGDGTLYRLNSRKKMYWRWELLGCYDFLAMIKQQIERSTSVKLNGPICPDSKRSRHLYRIYIGSQQGIAKIDAALNASTLGLPRRHFAISPSEDL